MSKKILTFLKFYRHKSPIPLWNVDIEKVLVSNKIFSGEEKTINNLLVTCIMMRKLAITYNAS